MEALTRSLNYELPKELRFDQDAQHILENSHFSVPDDNTATITLASTPTITSLESAATHHPTASDFFKSIGAFLVKSTQLQLPKSNPLDTSSLPSASFAAIDSTSADSISNMDFTGNHLLLDTRNYNSAMDDLQKQLEYDKFMNEIWIGIVLTLILISMIFCFCSCFLYHQFRMWKRNYRTTLTQSSDTESCKINFEYEDPVPEYTLVSGLPSYDAALELLHKNPKSCLIVHPSVFEVFNSNEKAIQDNTPTASNAIEAQTSSEASMPLLSESSGVDSKLPSYIVATLPSYNEATSGSVPSTPTTPLTPVTPTPTVHSLPYNHSLASILSLTSQKSQSKLMKSTPSTATAGCSEKQLKS